MFIFYIFLLSFLLVFILLILSFLICFYYKSSLEKNSSFECGFDSLRIPHNSFRVRFFVICIIFLIFDVELCLLIPLIKIFIKIKMDVLYLISFFLFILILGSIYELNYGSIIWIK